MHLTKSLLHTTDTYIRKLKEVGIETVEDFLLLFPRGYEDKSDVIEQFSLVNIKEKQAIKCKIELLSDEQTRNNKLMIKAVLTDSDGFHAEAIWWNRRMLLTQYSRGDTVLIFGQAKYDYGRLSWNSPDIELYREKRREILPIYSDTNYIPGAWIREKMPLLRGYITELGSKLTVGVPEDIRKRKGFRTKSENIRSIHFPESVEDFERARSELGYEELWNFQYRGLVKKYEFIEASEGLAPAIPLDTELVKSIIADLPFPLTNKQKIVLFQILKDMEKPHAMARLLQGDVGTGKTVVALIAAMHAILTNRLKVADTDLRTGELENLRTNLQVAIMAPTEILARQHFSGSETWLAKWGIQADLLVGSLTPRMKEEARERLKSGQTDIIFGTHALIQDSVRFKRLGFVVVDEQHRFGVEQRKALEEYCSGQLQVTSYKLQAGSKEHATCNMQHATPVLPHRLNMSATPIPRTLALTIYGDQDISVLDEYPAGRKPIHTRVVKEEQRVEIYRWIDEEVKNGRQVYWISPLVGESESISPESKEDIASAIHMRDILSGVFPHLHIGLIHGRMSGKEKDSVMQDFYENKIHILSSTSVVEVGVNNPNATIICIEAAERFGLSQLHQFRGRVGRGDHQSYCYLFTTKEYKSDRLRAMEQTNDGFELAEIDLELRGPGEVYGVRQSGVPDFFFADLRDVNLISEIREEIEEWMKGKSQK